MSGVIITPWTSSLALLDLHRLLHHFESCSRTGCSGDKHTPSQPDLRLTHQEPTSTSFPFPPATLADFLITSSRPARSRCKRRKRDPRPAPPVPKQRPDAYPEPMAGRSARGKQHEFAGLRVDASSFFLSSGLAFGLFGAGGLESCSLAPQHLVRASRTVQPFILADSIPSSQQMP